MSTEPRIRWTTRGVGRYQVTVRLPGHPVPLLSVGPLHELQGQVDRLLAAWGVGAGVRALGDATERALRAQAERWLGTEAAGWPLDPSGLTTRTCTACGGSGCLCCHQRGTVARPVEPA